MMTLSLTKLSQAILQDDPAFLLVRYIFGTQGFRLARLDYDAAGEALGISGRTVGRTVKQLAEKEILFIEKDKLRLNETLQKN